MKRLVFAVISGAMGSLIGLLFALLTGHNSAIIICGIAGAALAFLVRPGKEV
jgi:hypothetical protein